MDLSIIVPVYNTQPNFLQECLASIDSANIQTPYELIIVNDGSTNEKTLKELQIIEKTSKVFHQTNKGASAARNTGLRNANGKYILCLDADDLLQPSINDYLIFLKNNKNFDIAYGDWQNFGDSDFRFKAGSFSKFRHIYIEIQVHTTSLFRKSILEKIDSFNENFPVSEDWDFWARAASAGCKFAYMKKPLFLYRKIRDGQSLSQKATSQKMREHVLENGKKQFNPHQEITIATVNEFVLSSFAKNKMSVIKLLLIIFFKPLFIFLMKLGFFKNNIIVD